MGVRVLVTRPQPGAAATGRRLLELGFAPTMLPLSEIVALAVAGDPPRGIAAVVVTSANAVRHLPETWLARIADLPVFAVGATTAEACRNAGFARVHDGPGNAGGLAKMVVGKLGEQAGALYLCGRVRLPDFEEALAWASIVVHPVEAYDTRALDYGQRELDLALGREPFAAVLLYSREAALNYARLLTLPGFAERVMSADHLCLSARVAAALEGRGLTRIRTANCPTEEALLFLLPAP